MGDKKGNLLATIPCAMLAIVAGGYTFSVLWGWFVVPIFGHPITWQQAVGINLTVSFPFYGMYARLHAINPKDDTTEWPKSLGFSLIACPIVLGIGWVYKLVLL